MAIHFEQKSNPTAANGPCVKLLSESMMEREDVMTRELRPMKTVARTVAKQCSS